MEYLGLVGVRNLSQTEQPGQPTTGLGPIDKIFLGRPTRENQLKIFTLH